MTYKITLENPGGVIDERAAETEEDARTMAIDILAGINNLCDGDVLRVVAVD